MDESRACEAPFCIRRVHNTLPDTGIWLRDCLALEIGPLVNIDRNRRFLIR
jgi:hypothetical protein